MGHELPWLKFYPRDWRGDQALRVCSIAARGLWMEMLCVMHESSPYGYLTINGRPLKDDDLARLAGTDLSTAQQAMAELEAAGVFSRDRNRVIYSRRMTRDEKRRKDGAKASQTGTLPTSRRGLQVIEETGAKSTTPRVVGGVVTPPPSSQRAEAISRKNSKEVLEGLTKGLTGKKQKSKEEIKILWQTGILNEARRRLADDAYAAFVESWANDDPKAQKFADLLDRDIRARKRRAA